MSSFKSRFEDFHARITAKVKKVRLSQSNTADELHDLYATFQQLQDKVLVSNHTSSILDHLAARINEVEANSVSQANEELQRLGNQLDNQLSQFLADLRYSDSFSPSAAPSPSVEKIAKLRQVVDNLSVALSRQGREIQLTIESALDSKAALHLDLI